jgi:hypothetical protein
VNYVVYISSSSFQSVPEVAKRGMKDFRRNEMGTWKINLKEETATSNSGITFKETNTKPGEYEGELFIHQSPIRLILINLEEIMGCKKF